jgi:hypothetical protein
LWSAVHRAGQFLRQEFVAPREMMLLAEDGRCAELAHRGTMWNKTPVRRNFTRDAPIGSHNSQ